MAEQEIGYLLTDDEGDKTEIKFIFRSCCCPLSTSDCVDDEIQIFEDGPDKPPMRLQVPRSMTGHFERLCAGDFVKVEEKPRNHK